MANISAYPIEPGDKQGKKVEEMYLDGLRDLQGKKAYQPEIKIGLVFYYWTILLSDRCGGSEAGRTGTAGLLTEAGVSSLFILVYSGSSSAEATMALMGQTGKHAPHSMQVSGSMIMKGLPL